MKGHQTCSSPRTFPLKAISASFSSFTCLNPFSNRGEQSLSFCPVLVFVNHVKPVLGIKAIVLINNCICPALHWRLLESCNPTAETRSMSLDFCLKSQLQLLLVTLYKSRYSVLRSNPTFLLAEHVLDGHLMSPH